jgi:metal-responsive CopG/Arc/MetJ family transcriptional regulator
MSRLVLRLPDRLGEMVAEAAEEENKLPTEWVRDVLREALEEEDETETEQQMEAD